MSNGRRPHIFVQNLGATSDLFIQGDQITLSVAITLRNNGQAAAQGTASNVIFMPQMVPVPGPGGDMVFPPGPKTLLAGLCDRLRNTRSMLMGMNHNFGPDEIRHSTATIGLDLAQLGSPGAFFEDRSFVPMIFSCTSYVSATDRSFYQTGQAFQVTVRDRSRPGHTCDPVLDLLPFSAGELVIIPHEITGVLEK